MKNHADKGSQTIFEKSQEGQSAYSLNTFSAVLEKPTPPAELLRRSELELPEISEIDLTRHFTGLSKRNMGIDNAFYPLGSCTMKLNPRVNEQAASLPQFSRGHPLLPDFLVQGNLRLIAELTAFLVEISGMSGGTLLPNAGAQGEFVGVRMITEYHKKNGQAFRDEMLIPDNAHGTNPATAAMCGYKIISIRSNAEGDLDLESLKSALSERTAGLMLTNPNTLGLFSGSILEVKKLVHEAGGLLYYDGANLNPILNIVRPGEMGFDVMHINLHKTFSTPHGGGGPGSGPVLCQERLVPFLPVPRVEKIGDRYETIWGSPDSIGQIATFHGNFGIYLRAYLYSKLHGHAGLRKNALNAVLNANYLKKKIASHLKVPYDQPCMHEFVVQADRFLDKGIKAYDIAKRLLDYGVHSPTVYFPLIVKECLLIEPTESESKKTLDDFAEAIANICREAEESPEIITTAPHTTPVSRLDEVRAAKYPRLNAF